MVFIFEIINTMVFKIFTLVFNSLNLHTIILKTIMLLFRACIFSHYCHTNCFFIILSWLPTYFNDNFPEAKSWIFNVVPWILMVPGTGIAWLFSRRLGKRGYSAGSIRKISEGIAMVTEAVCLIGVGKILFCDRLMLTYHAHRPVLLLT